MVARASSNKIAVVGLSQRPPDPPILRGKRRSTVWGISVIVIEGTRADVQTYNCQLRITEAEITSKQY
jgi:hypothetical protein